MDDLIHTLAQLLNLGEHYPDLLSLLAGGLVGYVFTATVEAYFLPIVTTDPEKRRQKGLTFLICWMASGAASAILWAFLDPRDKPLMRITVSYLIAILTFTVYPMVARLLTAIVPAIGTVWARRQAPP